MTAVALAALGATGAIVRWQATRRLPAGLALLVVNLTGSFLLGLILGVDAWWVEPVGIGGLGALTSYSSFSLEAANLAARSRPTAVLYVVSTITSCVAVAALGRALG